MLQRSDAAVIRYGMAVLAIGVASAAAWYMGSYPFLILFLAVTFSAWFGGFGPALLAATIAFGTSFVLFDRRPTNGHPIVGIAMYWTFAVAIASFGGYLRRARQRIERQIEELTRQRAELRLADQRKDEFLAVLAHELRNPLAPIASALDILKLPDVDRATAERARDIAERQHKHLTRLVDDLLDVSRIMRGKIELRKEKVELSSIAHRGVETARPLIESARHKLTISLPDEPMWLEGDVVRLSQSLGNLLCNAAKYTEAGGEIELAAVAEESEVVLRVRDNGIGIAPDVMPRMFEMFMQVAPGASRSQGGLGIGLTLVKSLVAMHGGTVEANSDGLGKGSEFVMRLPRASAPATAEPESSDAAVDAVATRKILVVDDNADAAQSLAVLLRLRGHDVQVALGGSEALQAADESKPELVFLDIGMPEIDGFEVARRLRTRFDSGLTIVALTGWGTEQDRQMSREAGFDHHLTKPVDLRAVESVLADASVESRKSKLESHIAATTA